MTSTGYRIPNLHVDGSPVSLFVTDCANCGVVFAITHNLESRRREDGQNFYCPNGHPMIFGKGAIARAEERAAAAEAREKAARAREDRAWVATRAARDQADAAERSARAYRGHLTRMKRKIAAGVCPVGNCRRHFDNVQAHILTQHSAWAGEHPEALT